MNYRISKAFQISNEPMINLTISTTCGDKEGKKEKKPHFKKMLHSKHGLIHC
jgi:hypothetical protein